MATSKPKADKAAAPAAAPALPTEVGIGLELRDKVTGFTGIATQMTTFMSGNRQIALQPKAVAGATEIPEAINFDYHTLEVVGLGVVDTVIPVPADAREHVKLGMKAKDVVTGSEGTLTTMVEFMNGCLYFSLVAARKPGQTVLTAEHKDGFFEWARLKPVGTKPVELPGHAKRTPAAKAADAAKPPGGPRAPTRRMT